MDTLTALTQLLIQPPGSFAYHLVVMFAVGGTLQAAWLQWQRTAYPQTRRLLVGAAGLLFARWVFFTLSGLAWEHVLLPHYALPIADRAAGALALVLLTWLWAFPERHRGGDTLLTLAVAAIVLASLASVAAWPYFAERYFNTSLPDLAWSMFNLALGVGGLVVLARRRPDGAAAGFIAVGVITFGYAVHVLLPPPVGDLDGYLRLADLVAFPLLLTLPYRFTAPVPEPPVAVRVQEASAPPPKAAATDALLELLSTSPTDKDLCPRLAKAVAFLTKADLCLVVTPPRRGKINIACAYDLIREQPLSGVTLDAQRLPILTAAMTRRRTLRLPASSTSADVRTLAATLQLQRTGPILAAPLTAGEGAPVQGSVVLLSAYAQHSWTAEEQTYLNQIAARIGRWLARAQASSPPAPCPEKTTPRADDLAQRVAALEEQILALSEENTALRAEAERSHTLEARLQDLAAIHDEAQRRVEQLMQENSRLQAALERAAEAARARDKAHENLEVLIASAQDLRQPLSALIGYADLLLGESVGLLGELQRQFVERIRQSAERMAQAVGDIVQVLTLEAGGVEARPQEVDLNQAIDEALARASEVLRARQVLLRVDLPETLPPAQLDKEMLQQILHHLLRNAALASPEGGEVRLEVQVLEEESGAVVLIAVTDSGRGVAAEDIPHVFSRRYRAAYRVIEGLGDNGVGLPLVKALTEAMNGRIWAQSAPGEGTTFSVLLPLRPASVEGEREH